VRPLVRSVTSLSVLHFPVVFVTRSAAWATVSPLPLCAIARLRAVLPSRSLRQNLPVATTRLPCPHLRIPCGACPPAVFVRAGNRCSRPVPKSCSLLLPASVHSIPSTPPTPPHGPPQSRPDRLPLAFFTFHGPNSPRVFAWLCTCRALIAVRTGRVFNSTLAAFQIQLLVGWSFALGHSCPCAPVLRLKSLLPSCSVGRRRTTHVPAALDFSMQATLRVRIGQK